MKFLKKIKILLTLSILLSFKSEERITLKWDFNNFQKLTYEYSQEMINKTEIFGLQKVVSSGILEVKTDKSKQKANIILKMTQIKTFDIDEKGKETETSNFGQYPDFNIGSITEDGKYEEIGNPQLKYLIRILLPIANKELKINETYELPLSFDYTYFKDKITIEGNNKILYCGKDEIKTDIKVSNITDKKLEKDFECSLIGNSDFNFDKEKKYYTNANIFFIMDLKKKHGGFSMNAKNKITMKLKNIE